jgi:hypothetical protein
MSTTEGRANDPNDPMLVDLRFIEHPGWPAGTRVTCHKCGSPLVLHPQRTVDPRWAFGWCVGCKKKQVADVSYPPSVRP